jgi:RNA polymerase sigma-70 factor (ECF subfamily)
VSAEAEPVPAGELFRCHAAFVARFLVRYGVPVGDVDDVLQEVFLVAHRHGGYRPGPAKPTTWLATIAMRLAATYRQKARTRSFQHAAGVAIEAAPSDAPTPELTVAIDGEMARLHAALRMLAPEHRHAFILFELEGEPCSSIAAATGVPVGTVHSRLHFARKRLRQALAGARPSPLTPENPRWASQDP